MKQKMVNTVPNEPNHSNIDYLEVFLQSALSLSNLSLAAPPHCPLTVLIPSKLS